MNRRRASDDRAARLEALDPAQSFIVQAPAGAGKTELLIQRYLTLLAAANDPEAVVAITFTRKAAGEMRERVLAALSMAEAGAAPVSEHHAFTLKLASCALERDRRQNWGLRDNPARMRIETIDSLCASITRQMPWLARFGAPPAITEKAAGLYREAARSILGELQYEERAGARGPLSVLLLHLDNDFRKAGRLLCGMLEKRDQWLRITGFNPDLPKVRARLEAALEKVIVGELAALRRAGMGFEPELPCTLEGWIDFAARFVTRDGHLRAKVSSGAKQFFENNPDFFTRLRDVKKLPPARFEDSQWEALEAAAAILPRAAAHLRLVFANHGTVDFIELSLSALEALGRLDSPSDLALALGHRIEHLLVDEFQDTSYTQYDLLLHLTAGWTPGDGHTVFLVGDPMQSIYRFREADVSLFGQVRCSGLGELRPKFLELSSNFRSDSALVEWVNQTFAAILPPEDAARGAVAAALSNPERAGTDEAGPHIHAFIGPNQQAEAARICELIETAGEGTTAVLVRSRKHLAELVRLLRGRRIPFQAVEIAALGEQPVIQDLMALAFALIHLGDRVSWLAVLRAPWCGLSLEDLHVVAGRDPHGTVWDLLRREMLRLSRDGARRAARILPVLENAISHRGRTALRALVEDTWRKLGGPACALSEADLADVEAFFDLLEGIEQGGDIGDFDALREQVTELFAQPDPRAGDRLQLMTIHKAKGLEFDTVIIPGMGLPTRLDDLGLLLWQERESELLVAPVKAAGKKKDPLSEYLNHLEHVKGRNEMARLLYVAATRARNQLHLLGWVRIPVSGEMKPNKNSFLGLLWPVVKTHFEMRAAATLTGVSIGAAPPVRFIRRLPVNWRPPAPPAPVAWRRAPLEAIAATQTRFETTAELERQTGSVMHALLRRIAIDGLEQWPSRRIPDLVSIGEAMLRNLGAGRTESAEAAGRIRNALSAMLNDSRGRWLLDRHAEAQCEYALSGFLEDNLYRVSIDRTFVDENGIRWIVDYKLSGPGTTALEEFLESEKAQYGQQLERYARLLTLRENRPTRLGLYFPLIGAWSEWPAASLPAAVAG